MKNVSVHFLGSMRLECYRGVLTGISRFARTRPGWSLSVAEDPDGFLRHLDRSPPHGLIAGVGDRSFFRSVRKKGVACVNVSNHREYGVPSVLSDDEAVGRLAAEYLLNNGHRHFIFAGSRQHRYSIQRQTGFRLRLKEAGYDAKCFNSIRTHPTQLREWLDRVDPPLAVFACNDHLAGYIAGVCASIGLDVPEDLSILGVDNDPLETQISGTPLSSVVPDFEQIGYRAAALLERLIQGRSPPSRPILLPPLRVETRQSTDRLAHPDREIARVLTFMRTHFQQPLSVDDLVGEVPLSRRTLEIRFKKAVGHTLLQEIQRLRVAYAEQLLRESSLPIGEIAAVSGFGEPFYFSRIFRKTTGVSPSQYRRQSNS